MAWRAREEEEGSEDDDDRMGRVGEWERWVLGMLGERWTFGVMETGSDEVDREESM